jgi:predicted dinucleotide-binding enzyme
MHGLEWNGRIVVDATNDWAGDDLNGRTSSELVADLVGGARVVKAANALGVEVLGSDPQEAGGRRVIFISGPTPARKRTFSRCSRTRASPRSTSATWRQAARCSRSTIRSPASI